MSFIKAHKKNLIICGLSLVAGFWLGRKVYRPAAPATAAV